MNLCINVALHTLRKMYATERYAEERVKGLSEQHSWEIIQKKIGHGERFRKGLFNTYIKKIMENNNQKLDKY